jgi:hypothetical protein
MKDDIKGPSQNQKESDLVSVTRGFEMFRVLVCQIYVYMHDYKNFQYSNRINTWQSAKKMLWIIWILQIRNSVAFKEMKVAKLKILHYTCILNPASW